jgi:2-methylcitrate dehydratase PrpD
MATTETLVNFVMDTNYGDFPDGVAEAAKNLVLDCLGAMLFGVREEASQMVIRYAKASGGVPEVGVVGAGFKTSLENAAFVNGTLTHSAELEAIGVFELDPQAFGNPQHIIAAALSIGDKFNLSGRQVIEGIVLGTEFQARFSRGCLSPMQRGFCPLSLYGPPAVAVMAAKMMGLSADQARMAVGGAMSWSSGFFRQMGTMLHYLEAGIGARNGVTATLLAREGITADPNLIEGEWGFCELFAPDGYDLDIMTEDFGDPFVIFSPGIRMKQHSCCAAQHLTIEVLTRLLKDNRVRYEDIDSAEIHIGKHTADLLRPDLPSSTNPRDGAETRFSVHHAHAVVLADGGTSFRAFTDVGASAPRYKDARSKVKVIVGEGLGEGRVVLNLKDGSTYSGGRETLNEDPKGWPSNPFTRDELVARHEALSRDVLSPKQIQRSVDLVLGLEDVPDISELMELATFGDVAVAA